MEFFYFAFIPCGAMLANVCIYDPAADLFPRTREGCIAYVQQTVIDATNGSRVVNPAAVCLSILKPANVR